MVNIKEIDKIREALTFYAEAWHKNYFPTAMYKKMVSSLSKYHCVAVAHLSAKDVDGTTKPVILKWTLIDLTNINRWIDVTKPENYFIVWPNYSEDILLEIPLTPLTNYN